ncbi:ser Thr phosphatase superfamily [Pyrenophora seminiperda CCB06]|uniref:Ser Thr phosphatase superfamily n=1 Tax=Pyrenophora seminiperda CCB06 TaxID=1302712 RepID=A0A3M7MG79_9PLEO|nr:ser Thr phosphatase superfamily [Pyrenophora seminiperda CCB06]
MSPSKFRRLSSLFSGPKTSFQVLSDLHLDHESQYLSFHIPVVAPFLILAGNIGRLADYDQYLSFLIRRCNLHEKVYLVLGALEFHGITWIEGLQLAQRMENDPGTKGRLEVLYESRTDVPGTNVTLLGCTLWSKIPDSDVSAVVKKTPEFYEETGIQEWDVNKHNEKHMRDLLWLADEVRNPSTTGGLAPSAATSRSKEERQIVVVTAFSPEIRESLDPWQVDAPWASAYGTNLLGGQDQFSNVKLWVFGTTGRTCEFKKGTTMVISNQRGRQSEEITGILDDGMSEKQKKGLFEVTRTVKI